MITKTRILKSKTARITQGYSNAHLAVDLVKNPSNLDDILAHSDGKVIWCQTGHVNNKGSRGNASYGNCVKIQHANGYSTLYAHLWKVYVKLGDEVKAGQPIGYMGNSGNSYGAHTHFEVRKDNIRIDPTPYLDADLPDQTVEVIFDVNKVADDIIAGKYGNGTARFNALKAKGYTNNQITEAQAEVNRRFAKPAKPAKLTADQLATAIIQGKYGNGAARKNNLRAEGYTDAEISAAQQIVNKRLR